MEIIQTVYLKLALKAEAYRVEVNNGLKSESETQVGLEPQVTYYHMAFLTQLLLRNSLYTKDENLNKRFSSKYVKFRKY
ncbi:hypothetical protein LOAG_00905 [Loa loa]|uniref:Uncharacterized protein n=1 Tax=Loa loa TaxID=7209 RepID=A0A1S0UAZ4_LOALO|nr:hypothetical protein LOAG_00905 [Loa loa]EFO27586.2 hypothetical protein LOAG_00905 [Loa loa]